MALIREICRSNDIEIVRGHVSGEHVHLLLSVPPSIAPSRVMQAIKGKTSHHLLADFRALQKEFWVDTCGREVLRGQQRERNRRGHCEVYRDARCRVPRRRFSYFRMNLPAVLARTLGEFSRPSKPSPSGEGGSQNCVSYRHLWQLKRRRSTQPGPG